MFKWLTRLRERYTTAFPSAETVLELAASTITKTPTEELLTDLEINKVEVRLYSYNWSKGWRCHIEFVPGLLPGTKVDFETDAFEHPRQALEAAHGYWFDHEHPPALHEVALDASVER